jgi:hypothetical protein
MYAHLSRVQRNMDFAASRFTDTWTIFELP